MDVDRRKQHEGTEIVERHTKNYNTTENINSLPSFSTNMREMCENYRLLFFILQCICLYVLLYIYSEFIFTYSI